MNSFARGNFSVDYEARIDWDRLRRERIEKTQRHLRERGIDALLLWQDENVRYLTSQRAIMLQYRSVTHYGVLLTRESGPVLLTSGGEIARVKEVMPWLPHAEAIPHMTEPGLVENVTRDVIRRYLKEFGVEKGKIGIDAATFTMRRIFEKELSGVEWVDGESFMYLSRVQKLPEEIKVIQEATAIADAVTQTAIDHVRAGVRECEVAAEAMRTLFRYGGEFAHLASPFVASGERMSPPTRFATDKIIRHGDIVFIDIGAMWGGYFGDVARTVICGKPSHRQQEIYTAVYECLQAGVAQMRPGNTNAQATRAFIDKAAEHGLEKNFIDLYIGHGCGVSPNEPPYVGEGAKGAMEVEFLPDMVFAVEPLIWAPGVRGGGGVRIEDMIWIREDGPETLSRAPYCEELLLD
ncbi:MAG: M24 family metallopeptidase [Nitrospinota bacterium]